MFNDPFSAFNIPLVMKLFLLKTLVFFAAFLIIFIMPRDAKAQVNVDVGGYGQAWVLLHDYSEAGKDVSGYRLRRGRLFARSRLNEYFSATAWLDFASPDRNLLDFHLDVHLYPWLNIRAGQFIMAGQTFDTARLVSSRLIFHERPMITTHLASAMGYDAFRDIGVMIHGNYGPLWYGIHAGNGTGRFSQAGTTISKRDWGGGLYGARIDYEIAEGLTFGGHASINSQRNTVITGTERDIERRSWSLRIATDGLLHERFFTEAEYAAGEQEDGTEYNFNGYYAQAGYKVTDDWYMLIRYDQFKRVPDDGARFKSESITLGSLYLIRHNSSEIARIGLNYRTGKDNPGSIDNYTLLAWLQVRFIP